MAQNDKRGLFASIFGSKKKVEEYREAEEGSRQKLEDRIREVLTVIDPPTFEPAVEPMLEMAEPKLEMKMENVAESEPAEVAPSLPAKPAEEPEYTYLYLSTVPRNAA